MDYEVSAKAAIDTLDLTAVLARLGLEQYEELLAENGFDAWETVVRITEADMSEIGLKLGHRRKLQRAIHEHNNATTPTGECLAANIPQSFGGLPVIGSYTTQVQIPPVIPARTKRTYRRHPQPDHNAPRKPKTAYVTFTEHVRKDPAVSTLSFADIAKEVGRRWGSLSHKEKTNVWEKPAAENMQKYDAELEQYKKTESYQSYQAYLKDFKQSQRKRKAMELPDLKDSPASGSTRLSLPRPSRRQEGRQNTSQTDYDSADQSRINRPGSDTPSQQQLTSPGEYGMEEVKKVLGTLGVNPQYARFSTLPPQGMTSVAVEAFLHGTGSLLSLWEHDEAIELIQTVYHPKHTPTHVETTELFAMAALGSHCDSEAVTSSIPENFLHFFLGMMVLPSDISDLHRMRLFTCLAVCRFTESVESSRKLISR
jgi:hypothetical protein